MRKPISKHALRRAIERVHTEGLIQWNQPVGTVVDRIWHELEKNSYNGTRKKPVSRDTLRDPALVEIADIDASPSEVATES
jgi:DNA-binding FadR family transcriptional regulator